MINPFDKTFQIIFVQQYSNYDRNLVESEDCQYSFSVNLTTFHTVQNIKSVSSYVTRHLLFSKLLGLGAIALLHINIWVSINVKKRKEK